MTPEEIERTMDFILQSQAESLVRMDRLEAKQATVTDQVQTLASATSDLASVSRHLVNVQGELIESNSLLRQLVESHSKRLDRLEGEGRN